MYEHKWKPKKEPWAPADYDDGVISAIHAMSTGTANQGQQRLFWDYLMYVSKASDEFADLSFRPGADGDRDTFFAEGKRFVGLQIRKLLRPELAPQTAEEAPHPHQPVNRRQIGQRMRRAREKFEKERRA